MKLPRVYNRTRARDALFGFCSGIQKSIPQNSHGSKTDEILIEFTSKLFAIPAEATVMEMASAISMLSNSRRRKACRAYRNAHSLPHPRANQTRANQKPVFYEPAPTPEAAEKAKKRVEKLIKFWKPPAIRKPEKPAVSFYESDAWLELRYRAIKLHGGYCQCCGRRPSRINPLHIDHIKPRSKYPELELDIDNLQVLCKKCNLGKRAWDETDWRSVPLSA